MKAITTGIAIAIAEGEEEGEGVTGRAVGEGRIYTSGPGMVKASESSGVEVSGCWRERVAAMEVVLKEVRRLRGIVQG
jgi:hypothetical protein